MATLQIDHIGIAVRDIHKATEFYNVLLNAEPYKMEDVASEQVRTVFYKMGESKVELLQALSPESAIARFIEKRGEGIHHIAYEVDDIYAEITRLKAQGVVFVSDQPKQGTDNKLIVFIHPSSTGGVLTELCQTTKGC